MHHDLTLAGLDVTLRPLQEADIAPLCALAREAGEELRWMGSPPTAATFYELALSAANQMPFSIYVEGQLAGSTRYGDIRPQDSGLEIGWTWLHPRWYGTGVNKRIKNLLLAHAFDTMKMVRVQLKTDARNLRSQAAIAGLGATREGVLRKHIRLPDGLMRDTVMFSITDEEWPRVRAHLEVAAPAS